MFAVYKFCIEYVPQLTMYTFFLPTSATSTVFKFSVSYTNDLLVCVMQVRHPVLQELLGDCTP